MENTVHLRTQRLEFESFYKRSYHRAYSLACKLTGNEADAEDLTQDAYVKAWKAFDRYDKHLSFEVWLFRIISNLAIDRWRRKSTLQIQSLDQPISIDNSATTLGNIVPDPDSEPERICLRKFYHDKLYEALDNLPGNYREAIRLTDIEKWSYEEAAYIMSCPVGTIRSRLHRGRKLLRESLKQILGEDFFGESQFEASVHFAA